MNELNFNFNQCVKEISNFGSTTFQNICNGATSTVPWGTLDWVIMGAGAATILAVVLVVAVGLIYIAYEVYKI